MPSDTGLVDGEGDENKGSWRLGVGFMSRPYDCKLVYYLIEDGSMSNFTPGSRDRDV